MSTGEPTRNRGPQPLHAVKWEVNSKLGCSDGATCETMHLVQPTTTVYARGQQDSTSHCSCAHMFYHAALILLFRPFIRSQQPRSATSNVDSPYISPHAICTSSAMAITKCPREYQYVYSLRRYSNCLCMLSSLPQLSMLFCPLDESRRPQMLPRQALYAIQQRQSASLKRQLLLW